MRPATGMSRFATVMVAAAELLGFENIRKNKLSP